MNAAKVIPCKFYRTPDGRTFSRFSSYIPADAVEVTAGFTLDNPDGTQGCGRKPFDTESDAQAWLDSFQQRTGRPFQGMAAFTQ